jgi:hypothetical protein
MKLMINNEESPASHVRENVFKHVTRRIPTLLSHMKVMGTIYRVLMLTSMCTNKFRFYFYKTVITVRREDSNNTTKEYSVRCAML